MEGHLHQQVSGGRFDCSFILTIPLQTVEETKLLAVRRRESNSYDRLVMGRSQEDSHGGSPEQNHRSNNEGPGYSGCGLDGAR